MRYLLDTCVISELIAKQPSPAVVSWVDNAGDENLYLSVITIGEIQKGVKKLPDSKRKDRLEKWLNDELLVRFSGRILRIDTDTMLVWGDLTARMEKQGRKLPAIDSLIAAIALQRGLDLVTRNEDDFKHSGVTIVNPWR